MAELSTPAAAFHDNLSGCESYYPVRQGLCAHRGVDQDAGVGLQQRFPAVVGLAAAGDRCGVAAAGRMLNELSWHNAPIRSGVTPMIEVLHLTMPTTNRRHAITETDDIAAALQIAAKTWPDLADKPAALLRGLIILGRNTLVHDRAAADGVREQSIDTTAGALAGVFAPNYLQELREDWPA
jgi:hypothetical protein